MSIKPLGSERLQGDDKIKRILEIASFGQKSPDIVNENKNYEYKLTLADGNEYKIIKEKVGYIIKKTISESEMDYIEPMKNRKYYTSYSQALKRLNLMAKEMNTIHENEQGVSLFSEQKKFVLKTPGVEKKNPEPSPEVENVPPPPPPASTESPESVMPPSPDGDMGGMEQTMPSDTPPATEEPTGTEGTPTDSMGGEEPVDDEEVSLKVIQKLTGKLGQKLRTLSSKEGEKMSSKDIKYVINSILSALDLSSLEDEDKEEILTKFEDIEADEDMGGEESTSEEPMTGDEMGGEEPSSEPTMGGEENIEGEMSESDSPWVNFAETLATKNMADTMSGSVNKFYVGEESSDDDAIMSIANEVFTESKVENILKKYFVIEEKEKKFNKRISEERKLNKRIMNAEVLKQVNRLSETAEQEDTARSFLKGKSNVKFIGKTNMKNLVFEFANERYKITVGGDII